MCASSRARRVPNEVRFRNGTRRRFQTGLKGHFETVSRRLLESLQDVRVGPAHCAPGDTWHRGSEPPRPALQGGGGGRANCRDRRRRYFPRHISTGAPPGQCGCHSSAPLILVIMSKTKEHFVSEIDGTEIGSTCPGRHFQPLPNSGLVSVHELGRLNLLGTISAEDRL